MDMDVSKLQFLGCVDYVDTGRFARLRPLLFSTDGRSWEGAAKRDWFPNEGLVFSVSTELKHAKGGSMWIFRAIANSKANDGPDRYAVSNPRAAVRLATEYQAMEPEEARRFAVVAGMDLAFVAKTISLPEEGSNWIVTPELTRGDDGLYRVQHGQTLKHVKSYEDVTAEELCGMPTADGHYFLPPSPAVLTGVRNWLDPNQFASELAKDLAKWVPHGPFKEKARDAASAFRVLAPYLTELSALKGREAEATLLRAKSLSNDAEAITSSVEEIVSIITSSEPFKAEIENERARIRAEMEEVALAEAEASVGERRAYLIRESEEIERTLAEQSSRKVELSNELVQLETEIKQKRDERDSKLGGLEAEFDALWRKIEGKPAKFLVEWLATSGLRGQGSAVSAPSDALAAGLLDDTPLKLRASISGMQLAKAFRETLPDNPRYRDVMEWMDIAVRARELPVLIGPMSRLFAEAWLRVVATDNFQVVSGDPTLLSLRDFLPEGGKASSAPLAKVVKTCRENPDRLSIVLLDDPDPAAAAFWLPEFARAIRSPSLHGFPPNLVALCVFTSPPSGLEWPAAKAVDLFPLLIGDIDPAELEGMADLELPFSAIQPEKSFANTRQRASTFSAAAKESYSDTDADLLAKDFQAYLSGLLGATQESSTPGGLTAELVTASKHIVIKGTDANA